MSKPEGILKKTKDNSRKNYRAHAEWMQGKRLGRPKQRFVDVRTSTQLGHWEKEQS